MLTGHAVYRFLYLSRLAFGVRYNVFGAIVSASRIRNASIGVAGVLLFDGERFCQLLEGDAGAVQTLAERIETDSRHRDFVLLHSGPFEGERLTARWRSGYCGTDDLDRFDGIDGLRGGEAIAAFLDITARADLSF